MINGPQNRKVIIRGIGPSFSQFVDGAMREAFAMKDRLVFMDFITDQTENVFPMVPGGKGLSEMILV